MARIYWTASVVLAASAAASASTITFSVSEVNLGQDAGDGVYGFLTSEWSSFGITMSNVYLYHDQRDWGPDFNGVAAQTAAGGDIFFADGADNLSVKWSALSGNSYTITAYDAGGTLLESFTYSSKGINQLGITSFTVDGIFRINFHNGGGFVSASELTFDSHLAAVPLPQAAGLALVGLGVVGLRRPSRRRL